MNITVLLSLIAIVSSVNSSNGTATIEPCRRLYSGSAIKVFDENVAQVNQLDDLRQMFEKSKGKEFPNLDKLEFEHEHVDYCGPVLCIRANITKGNIQGLGGYELFKSKFESNGTQVSLDLDINFPSLLFKSEYYEMEGNIMGAFPLAGKGKLQLGVNNLRFWTKVELSILEEGPTIDEFANPGFSIESILSRVDFDGNIDDIFNTMVEQLVPGYLNKFNSVIAAYCAEVLKELLNPILRV